MFGIAYGDTLASMDSADLAVALDDAVAVGAKWARLDFNWGKIQPDGPTFYRWSNIDRIVLAARARGLSLLPTLAYTPPWARPANCHSDKCGPVSPGQFANFSAAAVRRYGRLGVHTWEIWNEENTQGFWQPGPDAAWYSAVVEQSASAIRKADSHAYVVVGGLTAVQGTPKGAIDQLHFLAQLCKAGINRVVDAIGYHPYTYPYLASFRSPSKGGTPMNKVALTQPSFRSVLAHCGTPNLPVWITEYGAPTGGPGGVSDGSPASLVMDTDHVTEQRQAAIAGDAVRTAIATPGVCALFWYSDRDWSTRVGDAESFFGLRRSNGTAKPAFAALRKAISAAKRPG